MNLIEFSSRLDENDMKIFLTRYAGFDNCEVYSLAESKRSNEVICYFCHKGSPYRLNCSDFFMRIHYLSNENKDSYFRGTVTDDDWFCFLKSKFGMEFVKQYIEMFNAKSIIEDESKYISKVPDDELIMILKRIASEHPIKALPFSMDDSVKFIEVESFFKSERRFLVKKECTNLHFFIRISDFQVISPRFNDGLFHRFMVGKFGREYISDYEKYLFTFFKEDTLPRFIESFQNKTQKEVSAFLDYLDEGSD